VRWHTASWTGTWEIGLTLSQERTMIFRLFIVAVTAVAVLIPAALASLT
jgi:hypothetical protein